MYIATNRVIVFLITALLLLPVALFAETVEDDAIESSSWIVKDGTQNSDILKLTLSHNLPNSQNLAQLWDHVDINLQMKLLSSVNRMGLGRTIDNGKLALTLVDISDLQNPRVASLNGDRMMYAASLPKIAILLGAFEKIANGQMSLDEKTKQQLIRMIRVSSNSDATAMLQKVGKQDLAQILSSDRYKLYDSQHNGGLWVGKDYASAGVWRRDPIHNLSHGATTMQVARFYYMLESGQLVNPSASQKMKAILGNPGISHKFVGGLQEHQPNAKIFRKSGSWRNFHADSAIIEHQGARYIAVALMEDKRGGHWLKKLIMIMDQLVDQSPSTHAISITAPLPKKSHSTTGALSLNRPPSS
jgi:beta-lactamase class A